MDSHFDLSFNALIRLYGQRSPSSVVNPQVCIVTGDNLEISDVIAVGRNLATVKISTAAASAVTRSEQHILERLRNGDVIYGVNTGFGGSADTRTDATEDLQREIMRGLQYGITSSTAPSPVYQPQSSFHPASLGVHETPKIMPESWVRAAMLIRLNSLVRGASGVRLSTVQTLESLLNKNIVPVVPLRGSISASGDLSPLSYVGGAMTGKPAIQVWSTDPQGTERRLLRADIALQEHSIMPVRLAAKEGLAIVNGTAMSAAIGAIVSHELIGLAALSQVLSAMSVEALCGTDESFDPFFASVRPHIGQAESAANILSFLKGSQFVIRNKTPEEASLRQDRYSIRTVSQWLGPLLEDTVLAVRQIHTEINSVTDNPLVDVQDGHVLHGGNFQAKAVTSAMEKLRQASQSIGRMLFVQCTELMNPATSNGLPPNLVVDEPNESFIWKGVDIYIAALQSELGFLANPVGSHVQTAEMGNQSLNSLALISARYTLTACDILSQMAAAHLAALCQAIDIRAMDTLAMREIQNAFQEAFAQSFPMRSILDDVDQARLIRSCQAQLAKSLSHTTTVPSDQRFERIASAVQALMLVHLKPDTVLSCAQEFSMKFAGRAREIYLATKESYASAPNAVPFLGPASGTMYKYVRQSLNIPLVENETIRTPPPESLTNSTIGDGTEVGLTVGSLLGKIYDAIENGLHTIYKYNIASYYPLGQSHMTCAGLSAALDMQEDLLRRVLRQAMTYHALNEPEEGVIEHTPASKMLREISCMSDWLGKVTQEIWLAATQV